MKKRRSTNRPTKRRLVALDLFSGAGGLTLGLRHAGFKVIGAIESDPLAVESYRRNHLRTFVWESPIEEVSVAEVRRKLRLRPGRLDLLAGCPPCQGFSAMTTRNGSRQVRDSQKDLLFQFLRFVRGLKPKVVMMENVPGLARDQRRMSRFRSELKRLGYRPRTRILNAVAYGVPQRRRRMIFLAGRFGPVAFAQPETVKHTVRDAIRSLPPPGCSGDPLHDLTENRSQRVRALIRRIPRDGGSRTQLGGRSQLKCHKRLDGFKDVYGRMAWDEPAPTITGGFVNPSKGRFLHPYQNRAITLREAALLQTFPRRYYFSLRRGKFPAAGLIGNALPPKFIRRLTSEVVRYLRPAGRGSGRCVTAAYAQRHA